MFKHKTLISNAAPSPLGDSRQSMPKRNKPKDASIGALSRPFWILLLFSFAGMAFLVAFLTHWQNSIAVERSERLFASVLSDLHEQLANAALEYGYWDQAVENLVERVDPTWAEDNLGEYLDDFLSIDAVYVLDAANAPTYAEVGNIPMQDDPIARFSGGLERLIADARASEAGAPPKPVTGFVRGGNGFHIASALRMTTYDAAANYSTDHVLVFVRFVDAEMLSAIADRYLLPKLRIATAPGDTSTAHRILRTYDGDAQGAFTWAPSLPGSDLLPTLVFGLAIAFLAMTVVAVWFVRRATEAETVLQRAVEQADKANTAKSEFLRTVAHEIRTPVNAILGFARIMQQEMFGPIENQRYAAYIRDIGNAGDHALSVVNDLMDLSRIEAGETEFDIQSLDLREVAQKTVGFLREIAKEREIDLCFEAPEASLFVEGDERALRQILLNIVGNALKYAPAGGRVVCAVTQLDGRLVTIKVRDNGEGLTSEEIKKALEPFGQVRRNSLGGQTGTGLGLPISKSLTEAMGGEFRFESSPGEGTTVTITLRPTPANRLDRVARSRRAQGTLSAPHATDNADTTQRLTSSRKA